MLKYIESKDNNKIKHASSLKESKYRKEYNEFLSEGKKTLEMALKKFSLLNHLKISPKISSNISLNQTYLNAYLVALIQKASSLCAICKKENLRNSIK